LKPFFEFQKREMVEGGSAGFEANRREIQGRAEREKTHWPLPRTLVCTGGTPRGLSTILEKESN